MIIALINIYLLECILTIDQLGDDTKSVDLRVPRGLQVQAASLVTRAAHLE